MASDSSDQVPLMIDIGDRHIHAIDVNDIAITAGQARLGQQDAADQTTTAGGFRAPQRWDPVHIIIQIIVLQLLYYATLALLMIILGYGVLGEPINAELIFNWQHLHVYSLFVTMLFLLASLIMAGAVWKIVKRSRLCWDYAATLHAIHLLVTWFLLAIFLGVYLGGPLWLCRRQ